MLNLPLVFGRFVTFIIGNRNGDFMLYFIYGI